jgi:hypothetical protein
MVLIGSCLCLTLFAEDVSLQFSGREGPAYYGAKQLERALKAGGHHMVTSPTQARFVVELKTAGQGAAESYRIRRQQEGGRIHLRIEGNDDRGTLYGALALAESLETGTPLAAVQDTAVAARFPFRAIKFNLPWYSYRAGDALELHDRTCRDPAFWESFLDMMARNRFNTLSLWSLHPFPLMIRNPRFPEACPLSDAELAEWQKFWHKLFAMAKERGIDTYIVNWNIFVSPSFAAKHGVAAYCDQNMNDHYFGVAEKADIVKEYTRTTVTQLINTYSNLTGLGISLGERMGDMTAREREDWILETVVAGMQAAQRKARLIHRAPFSADTGSGGSTSLSTEALTRHAIESIGLPEPIWVEVKFNWSHAQSSPHLLHVHGGKLGDTYWNPMPQNYRICWMARNEDFFCLRWTEPDFVREHVALNGQPYVGGYFLGSECYIPAKDYMTRPELARPWRYAFERQWLYYMTWGRLLYDPRTPDDAFINACTARYGKAGPDLFEALKLGSRMPLRLGSFYKGTWDFTLYSEGFSSVNANSNPDHFLGLEDLIGHPVLDPDYLSIPDFVKARRTGQPPAATTVTPLRLADQLEADGNRALALLQPLHQNLDAGLGYEVADAEAWAHLSLYFAEKLRGAVAYHETKTGGEAAFRAAAVNHLTRALAHWDALIRVTEPIYAVMPLAQIHKVNRTFHWKLLRPQVVRDLDLAKQE